MSLVISFDRRFITILIESCVEVTNVWKPTSILFYICCCVYFLLRRIERSGRWFGLGRLFDIDLELR